MVEVGRKVAEGADGAFSRKECIENMIEKGPSPHVVEEVSDDYFRSFEEVEVAVFIPEEDMFWLERSAIV